MDKTHLRWFTRATIFELFGDTDFKIAEGYPRILDEPARDAFMPAIRLMAQAAGADPDVAVADALATQYLIRAIPSKS